MSNGIGGTAPGRSAKRKRFCARLASMVIILAFVFVAAPERAEAAYGQSFTAPVTQDNPQTTYYSVVESESAFPYVESVSYGSLYMTVSWLDQDLYGNGYVMQGMISGYLNVSAPIISGWTHKSTRVIIDDLSYNTAFTQVGLEPYVYTAGRGYFTLKISQINQRPQFGIMITYRVLSSYQRDASTATINDIYTARPTVTTQNVGFSGEYLPMTDLLPDLHTLKESLVGNNGWMSTINTNLQTLVTSQSTSNSYLSQLKTGQATEITHLSNILSRANDIKAAQATQISHENTMIANQETQISQIKQIVDYINNTAAADKVEDANQDFMDNAGALESGQADLENAADASLAAVDFSKVGLISTFSQSVNWWMRCVNFLPSGTGAIWDVLVFGFLIAFVMFILRLVR